jgi:hypothetical protein
MSQDDLEVICQQQTTGTSRTRTVRGAAERKEERRAVRQVAGWAADVPFNLSPAREIPHIEDPGFVVFGSS